MSKNDSADIHCVSAWASSVVVGEVEHEGELPLPGRQVGLLVEHEVDPVVGCAEVLEAEVRRLGVRGPHVRQPRLHQAPRQALQQPPTQARQQYRL